MKVEAWLKVKAKRSGWGAVYPTGHTYAGQTRLDSIKAVGTGQAAGEEAVG